MKSQHALLRGVGLAALITATSTNLAVAQLASHKEKAATSKTNKDEVAETETKDAKTDSDIIVVGVRQSIASSLARKRDSKNIVDSVVAEDAGKLPDNNVPEAIARVPGVNITRGEGQGGDVTIRGLQGIQTTINGNDVPVGDGRNLSCPTFPPS